MKWYDYLVILFFADALAAAIMSGSIFVGLFIGFAWSGYEEIRTIGVEQ